MNTTNTTTRNTHSRRRQSLGWTRAFSVMAQLEWQGADLCMPMRWIAAAINPLVYLLFLGVGLSSTLDDPGYLRFLFPGLVVMQASAGISHIVARVVTERRWGLAAYKLQAGVPAGAYFLAMMVPGAVLYLFQVCVIIVAAFAVGLRLSVLAIVVIACVGLVAIWFWQCFGYCLTGLIKDYQTRNFVLSLLTLPLTFSAPVFYSFDSAPALLRAVALCNPLTYQVNVARATMSGSIDLVSIAVTAALTLIVTAVGVISTQRMRTLSFEG